MAVILRRMLKRADFLKVKAEGQRASTQGFVLQYLSIPAEPGLCIGYTASIAAVGNSVARNKARRRLKAAFDAACRLNPQVSAKGLWLVFIAKKPVLELKYAYLLKDMQKALLAAGIPA